MHIFDTIIAAFIGALLTILPANTGASVDASASLASTTPSTTTAITAEDAGAIAHLRAMLLTLRSDLTSKPETRAEVGDDSELSTRDSGRDSEAKHQNDTAAASSSLSVRGESKHEDARTAHQETEDESGDDEDDDSSESHGSGRERGSASIPVQSAPAPAPTPTTQVSVGSFTLAQVATHNTAASCYSVVNGSVYDLTTWISRHPGGQSAIKGMCGVDASGAFNGQHGGQARPASELAGFKIGALAK